jgi:hypothetical protein
MDKKQISRLDDFIPEELKRSQYTNIKDLFGKVLVFKAVEFKKDDRGWKATFTCDSTEDASELYVTSRALQVMKVAKFAKQQNKYPFMGKFIAVGQAVMLVDPDYIQEVAQTEELPF